MYRVLYRKWRPRTFSEVVGQPQVTVTLRRELEAGRVSHAYLFTGPRGTGKTSCAKILAKAVNCLFPKEGDPCGECAMCRGIDEGTVLDVVEIDAASNNGVENIRSLREEANFTPASARYRVYIIDEVHMLSIGAFNALLKTLEEPPAYVVFILATTEVHKIPATILSRCQRFDFRRVSPADMASRLTYVAGQEGAVLDPQAAQLLARLADGGMRDALSLLDQCMGVEQHITIPVVDKVVGVEGKESLFRLAAAVREQNPAQALEEIDELYRGSKDMMRLCEELCAHFRALMLVKTMRRAQEVLVLTDEEYEAVSKQALPMDLEVILHALDQLQDALDRMGRGSNRRTEIEMALLRLCSPELDDSRPALLRRIAALERRGEEKPAPVLPEEPEQPDPSPPISVQRVAIPPIPKAVPKKSGGIPPPAQSLSSGEAEEALPWTQAPLSEETAPLPLSEQKPAAPPPKVEELSANAEPFAEWPEVLQILREYSKPVSAAFQGSVAYHSGSYILIDAQNSMAFELLRKEEQRQKMRDTIRQVTGRDYKLGPYKRPADPQEENDPLQDLLSRAREAGVSVVEHPEKD